MSRRSADQKLERWLGRVHVQTCQCYGPLQPNDQDSRCLSLRATLRGLMLEGWKERIRASEAP